MISALCARRDRRIRTAEEEYQRTSGGDAARLRLAAAIRAADAEFDTGVTAADPGASATLCAGDLTPRNC
jgi:hypothetical protein